MRFLFRRRCVAWTVLLAVLFAGLSPVLAALAHAADPVAYAEICRIGGSAADTRQAPQPQTGHQSHCCLLCVSGAHPLPSSPLTVYNRLPHVSSPALLRADTDRPYDASAHAPAIPRAPPRAI
jgi:hypothetical protein